ncbi:PDZ domain-containing protein [Adhaeribacter pallidiroseus]|uniref:PDZ domain-containing protein n=1 Tax=Adhaeribacter pallidiroseus TaxID=2072847 RepID=A0A369QP49_9BACT|nr:hypothetical protein [Adhaeribacter pallidiroseus]RDC65455.1 hypothetical protein AHMF7616_04085 [Adhaeribacter pallidiroseus]
MRLLLILLFISCHFFVLAQSSSNNLLKQQRLEEVTIIRTAFQQLHPGLYRYHTKAQLEQDFEKLARQAMTATDKQYFILLSQLASNLKCGHTYLNPWNQQSAAKKAIFSETVFPLLFQVIERKLIVAANLAADKIIQPGDEITAINGITTKRIMDSLLTVSRADGNNTLNKKLNNLNVLPPDVDSSAYTLFDVFFPLFFPESFNAATFTVEVIKPNKKRKKATIKALTKKERHATYVARYGALPAGEKSWQFKFLDSSIAYFKIGNFVTWSWKKDYKNTWIACLRSCKTPPRKT